MLLTLTTTHPPATDLGYVLAKHPARCQTFPLSFGSAHVFFPEAGPDRCTAALLLDLDPVDLVRGRRGTPVEGVTLGQYVNDRPYVASSFLSVAIARVLGTAMSGQSRERPDLAAAAIPLTAEIAVVRCVGGMALLTALFAPLGYDVEAERLPLDARFPAWGDSPYVRLTLSATCRVRDILRHLYVLLPVLDDDKHYWVGADETDKLLAMGDGWLADHPARELIVGRYLKHQRGLADDAVARLVAADGSTEREGDGVAGMGI
ncbi:MAG: 3' terminal RNA ribose 2'-O-methyltransferase Hen1, partial [Ardenticatenales bacterium]